MSHDRALIAAVGEQQEWMTQLLLQLLAAPTTLGREEAGQQIVEQAMTELELAPRSLPMDPDVLRSHPMASPFDWDLTGMRNVIGEWHPVPERHGRSLTLSGHVDVPVPQTSELWTDPPFAPQFVDGTFRGWGMLKAGLVAMLGAVRATRSLGLRPQGTLRLQSVVEEETGGNGALATVLGLPQLDAALVAACVGDTVPYASVGVMWFTVRVAVPPRHAGDGLATNAIELALELVPALKAFADEVGRQPPEAYRDITNPITLNVGAIHAGSLPSIGPGECELSCRIALFPGERIADRRSQVEQVVAQAAAQIPALASYPPSVHYMGFSSEGYELAPDSPVVTTLINAHERRSGVRPPTVALTTALDTGTFCGLGIPATAVGPTVQNLHAVDETVTLADLLAASETVALFIDEWCGLEPDDND